MDTLPKNKSRALRRAQTNSAIDRQLGIHQQHAGSPLARGRFKKQHAMDCGRPRCGLCGNLRKRHGGEAALTVQERRALEEDKYLHQDLCDAHASLALIAA